VKRREEKRKRKKRRVRGCEFIGMPSMSMIIGMYAFL